MGLGAIDRPETASHLHTDLEHADGAFVLFGHAVAVLADVETVHFDGDFRIQTSEHLVQIVHEAAVAGADIKEMQTKSYMDMFLADRQSEWEGFAATRTPIVAAVNGFALGGGCEIAMMCDIIIASERAKFGQPEIKLGVTPGWGGSQRLTKAVGKAKAMDLILTGRMMDAEEAERSGLVARVVPHDNLMGVAMETAKTIAGMGAPSVMIAKEQVNRAFETTLEEGLRFERRTFYSLFATEDQKEGMAAFAEKRPPEFKNK